MENSIDKSINLHYLVDKLKSEYQGKSLFPLGHIRDVTYSHCGQVLILEVSGDVPTAFQSLQIVIPHPSLKDNNGWVEKGDMGFNLVSYTACSVSDVPLPNQTTRLLNTIFREYTGGHYKKGFFLNDTNRVIQFGYYTRLP